MKIMTLDFTATKRTTGTARATAGISRQLPRELGLGVCGLLAIGGMLAAAAQPAKAAVIEKKVLVILLEHVDSNGALLNRYTQEQAREDVLTGPYSPVNFYEKESRGLVHFSGIANPTGKGDVVGPINIAPIPVSHQCSSTAYVRDPANAVLAAMGIDRNAYDHLIYVSWDHSTDGLCSNNGSGSTNGVPDLHHGGHVTIWDNDVPIPPDRPHIRPRTLQHEVGHNLGLGHAGLYECVDDAGTKVQISDDCHIVDQGDYHDAQGSSYGGRSYGNYHFAGRQVVLGEMPASDVTTVTASGVYKIMPLMGATGPRALKIARPGHGQDYWFETRQPSLPFDDNTDQWGKGSMMVRAYNRSYISDRSLMVKNNPNNGHWSQAPFQIGQTFTDTAAGISATLVSVDATTGEATITVVVPPVVLAGLTVYLKKMTLDENDSDDFYVGLNAQPTSNVVVDLTASDPTKAAPVPNTVTFTPVDWDTVKIIKVVAKGDADENDVNVTMTADIRAADSAPEYALLPDKTVAVTVNDTGTTVFGLVVTPSTLNVAENHGTGTFTVKLTNKPLGNVVVDISSSSTADATVFPSTLTFTPSNWNTAKTVTVTGVDDTVVQTDTAAITVAVNAANSSDEYDAVANGAVHVTLIDDEAPDQIFKDGFE